MKETTYKDNDRIQEVIKKVCEIASPFGVTDKTVILKNQLEAVAEIAYIQGQLSGVSHSDNYTKTVEQLYNKELLLDGAEAMKEAYNNLQIFLGSNQRIK